jgi:hypothetical protein
MRDYLILRTMSSSVSLPLSNIDRSPPEQLNEIDEKPSNVRQFFDSNWKNLKEAIRELLTFHPKQWLNAFRRNPKYPLFVLGDIDGFVALFVNNLATLLAVILGLELVFESDIIYGKILPG